MMSRMEFLRKLIESPTEVLVSWPFLLYLLILFGMPFFLSRKKFIERDDLKWKVWLLLFPVFGILMFFELFTGAKCSRLDLAGVLSWIGITLMMWLIAIPVVFLGRCAGRRENWENSPASADDCADELFDMALKIGKDKRAGKNTSEAEADYNRKLGNFNENGFLDDLSK